MSDEKRRPMGIMASFSKVTFKKDGAEVFTASVATGGCFGPSHDLPDLAAINHGLNMLKKAIDEGTLPATARDFNTVSIRGHEYAVQEKAPEKLTPANLKRINP